ncbi:MAG: hypothetical protein ACXAE3_12275 [Candidatus Kariarchaeaceae archaeon]|jgi:hypothetical protein
MSDTWEEDEKSMELVIPGVILPGFRDLRIQFIALIVFDLYLGPVVYLNEISKGSSYISKLRDYQTVSEVYAGVARADVDILTNPDDIIAVFRREHEDNPELSNVLLISCIPGSDMDPIKRIGGRALMRSRGDPQRISDELANALRDYQTGAQFFDRADGSQKIKILDDNQIANPLSYSFIKGFTMVDLDTKFSDFRYFPKLYAGREIEPISILNYFDRQFKEIFSGKISSFLFNGMTFTVTRVKNSSTYFIALVDDPNVAQIARLGDWMQLTNGSLKDGWRFANDREIRFTIEILNMSFEMASPPKFVQNYIQTSIRCAKLKPLIVLDNLDQIDRPEYVSDDMWNSLSEVNGSHSIFDLAEKTGADLFDYLRFMEWGRHRHIFEYLTK